MSELYDFALIGTGVAPLIAASELLLQGKTVLVLNPDYDFFLEDSEFAFDPLNFELPSPELIARASAEQALATLRPYVPGVLEFCSTPHTFEKAGFYDPDAPHVRQRGRIWLQTPSLPKAAPRQQASWHWDQLEDGYLQASEAHLQPELLDTWALQHKFPGFFKKASQVQGLYVPKFGDVDVVRFRYPLLEWMNEKLGVNSLLCGVNQMEPIEGGIRIATQASGMRMIELRGGSLVFWTPKLSAWLLQQAKRFKLKLTLPLGVRLWEEWRFFSPFALDRSVITYDQRLAIWADFEGSPPAVAHTLAILRLGKRLELESYLSPFARLSFATADSFADLEQLFRDKFLLKNPPKQEKMILKNLKTRATLEWKENRPWNLGFQNPPTLIVPASDGPLVEITKQVKRACRIASTEYSQGLPKEQSL